MIKVESNKMVYEVGTKVYAIDMLSLETSSKCDICNGTSELKIEGRDMYVKCTKCNRGIIKKHEYSPTIVECIIEEVKFLKWYEKDYCHEKIEYKIDSDKYFPRAFYFYDISEETFFHTKEDALNVASDDTLFRKYRLNNYKHDYQNQE